MGERIVGRPVGFWEDSWKRLKKNRAALVSLVLTILLFVMAFIVGPLLSRYSHFAQDLTRSYAAPSADFWFGTDNFGRDMWTRVWAGTRVSLYIALLAALVKLLVGVPFWIQFHPYLLWFPTMILVCFSLFGDGLRDVLDPRMRK